MPTATSIAFVCPRFADGATVGGAETLLRSHAERALRAGRKAIFLTTCATNHFTWQNELPPGARCFNGLDVLFFPVDENRNVSAFLRIQEIISRRGRVTPEEEMTWIRNSVNSRALCRHLEEHGGEYDRIVIGPYLFGLTYFASHIHPDRTLLVPCLHDEGFARVGLIGQMFRGVRKVLFNSKPELDLGRRLYGLPEQKCAVVGMGLEDFKASPSEFARRRGITAPYVIYSGRREPAKGVPLLLDYMAAFRARTGRDVKLVFTGTGRLDPPREMEPHILDAGFVSEKEKHDAMAGASVFCHPSVHESLSIVLLESWLAGTPAMVHAGCEVTRHHCRRSHGGLWFAIYPQFEEALATLLDNDDLRRAMGEAGRNYVLREYSWSAVEPRLLAALDEA